MLRIGQMVRARGEQLAKWRPVSSHFSPDLTSFSPELDEDFKPVCTRAFLSLHHGGTISEEKEAC